MNNSSLDQQLILGYTGDTQETRYPTTVVYPPGSTIPDAIRAISDAAADELTRYVVDEIVFLNNAASLNPSQQQAQSENQVTNLCEGPPTGTMMQKLSLKYEIRNWIYRCTARGYETGTYIIYQRQAIPPPIPVEPIT
jgi:hypothetical protein